MPKVKNRASSIGSTLGKRIREHRLAQGMTQGELAEIVKVETETISRLERGSTLPSLLKIEELAMTLKVPLADLLSGSSSLASDLAIQMAKLLEGLDEDDRRLIMNVAELQRDHLLKNK